MTRKEAKEAAMVMLAYANGEQVQVQLTDGSWKDLPLNPHFDWQHVNYRIKSEPKYRPFKTKKECWEEMHKHPDFGWVSAQDNKVIYHINIIDNGYIRIGGSSTTFSTAFAEYEFTDREPFGVKE